MWAPSTQMPAFVACPPPPTATSASPWRVPRSGPGASYSIKRSEAFASEWVAGLSSFRAAKSYFDVRHPEGSAGLRALNGGRAPDDPLN